MMIDTAKIILITRAEIILITRADERLGSLECLDIRDMTYHTPNNRNKEPVITIANIEEHLSKSDFVKRLVQIS